MRTKLITLTCITIANFTFVQGQDITFLDPNFKTALLNHVPQIDTNNDGEIQFSEAEAVTDLDLYAAFPMISDLTGIEYFVNLITLDVGAGALTSLDMSQNTALEQLFCESNDITTINVSQNTALELLWCGGNPLTTIDVSNNVNLISLGIHDSQLTSLDVSKNILLEELYCFENQLTTLNLFDNSALHTLLCDDNQLTSLNLINNTNLKYLFCTGNQITSLNLSNHNDLEEIFCTANQLTVLNIKNGNNTNITNFDATQNPNLTCIQVDNTLYSTSNWTDIDTQTSFSENCNYSECVVNIPDANFKSFLINLTSPIDINGDGEIQCEEAEAFTGSLFPIFVGITNMTGIEAFVNLKNLYCQFNQITSLDVSNNTQLEMLYCQNNEITDLNVNGATSLNFLFCADNQLTALDVSSNTAIENLWTYSNQLTTLDVSNNVNLRELMIFNNTISVLDLSNNVNLEGLACEDNQLTALDLSNKPNLNYLRCNNNQITSLDLSGNPALTDLQCHFNQLSSLNVKNGNNTSIVVFNSIANSNLTCIEVDDPVYSADNWTAVDGWSDFSEDCTVSVKYIFAAENISLYPNPVNDILHFSSNAPIQKVVITNMLGQTINANLNSDNTSLDMSSLPIGNYFVKVTIEGVSKTFKTIKN